MADKQYLTEEQIKHCWYFVGNNIDSFGQPVADNFASILRLVRHVEEHTENRLAQSEPEKVTVPTTNPDPIVEVKQRKKPGPAKGWYAAKKAAEAAAQAEANKNV